MQNPLQTFKSSLLFSSHQRVVQDLGEVIKDAKNRLGYAKTVLAGWSGGGWTACPPA